MKTAVSEKTFLTSDGCALIKEDKESDRHQYLLFAAYHGVLSCPLTEQYWHFATFCTYYHLRVIELVTKPL